MAVKRCRAAFTVWNPDGMPRVVAGGDLVDDQDPILKTHGHLFEDVDAYVAERSSQVEQATAEPGERRAVRRPARGKQAQAGDKPAGKADGP